MRATMVNTTTVPPIDTEELLRHVHTIQAVGPRPSERRSLMKILAIGLGLAIGVAASQTAPVQRILDPVWGMLVGGANVAPPASATPVVWVDGVANPWWTAAEDNAGHVDFVRWRQMLTDQGVTASQALAIWNTMSAAQSSWVEAQPGSGTAALDQVRQEATQWLSDTWSDPSMLKSLAHDPEQQRMLMENRWVLLDEQQRWEELELMWKKTVLSVNQIEHAHHFDVNSINEDLSVDDARAVVVSAVDAVGLAALRIPPTVANDPIRLQELAARLLKANADLQEVTGWSGGVLGLNERVVLDLTAVGTDGMAGKDSNGFINIKAHWSSLAHEWYHALDFAQTDYLPAPTRVHTLSEHHKPEAFMAHAMDDMGLVSAQRALWTAINNPRLTDNDRHAIVVTADRNANAMANATIPMFQRLHEVDRNAARTGVSSEGSPWLTWRRSASEGGVAKWVMGGEDYLLNPTEILAFSFAAHVNVQLGDTPHVLWPASRPDDMSVSYYPTSVEARALAPVWTAHLTTLGSWWDTDTRTRHAITAVSAPETVMDLSPFAKALHHKQP